MKTELSYSITKIIRDIVFGMLMKVLTNQNLGKKKKLRQEKLGVWWENFRKFFPEKKKKTSSSKAEETVLKNLAPRLTLEQCLFFSPPVVGEFRIQKSIKFWMGSDYFFFPFFFGGEHLMTLRSTLGYAIAPSMGDYMGCHVSNRGPSWVNFVQDKRPIAVLLYCGHSNDYFLPNFTCFVFWRAAFSAVLRAYSQF